MLLKCAPDKEEGESLQLSRLSRNDRSHRREDAEHETEVCWLEILENQNQKNYFFKHQLVPSFNTS